MEENYNAQLWRDTKKKLCMKKGLNRLLSLKTRPKNTNRLSLKEKKHKKKQTKKMWGKEKMHTYDRERRNERKQNEAKHYSRYMI